MILRYTVRCLNFWLQGLWKVKMRKGLVARRRSLQIFGIVSIGLLTGCMSSQEQQLRNETAYNAFDEVVANGEILDTSDAAFGATKMVVKHNGTLYTCFMHVLSIDKSRCEAAK